VTPFILYNNKNISFGKVSKILSPELIISGKGYTQKITFASITKEMLLLFIYPGNNALSNHYNTQRKQNSFNGLKIVRV